MQRSFRGDPDQVAVTFIVLRQDAAGTIENGQGSVELVVTTDRAGQDFMAWYLRLV